ncbi:TIR-like protein FxsC [Dactylosporangium sp. NPDC048998]|uniref:TIR-like protein FxsC n=1 Tax=Dactylosporangium sp. NPDC048998 TaxID=3363976 RepID=UPI003715DA8F
MLYFFLSYARGPDDLFVRRFYNDLCSEVRVHAGLDRDAEVGFLDNHNIEPGQNWPQALINAIAECSCFLALYSPAYFLSQPCGKEWTMFDLRSRGAPRDDGTPATGLIPVVWLPPRELPDVAKSVHYDLDVQEEDYRRRGLRQLLRLQRMHDAYIDFLSTVAERIVAAANTPPPRGSTQLDFERLESAFHPAKTGPGASGELPPRFGTGQTIHFVIAAPSGADAAAIERDAGFYGEDPLDWAPFRPVQARPLREYAQKVASELGFESLFTGLDRLGDRVKVAQQHNHVVVLLVDPWSADVPAHRELLLEYDHHREHVSAMLVVMSAGDVQTQEHSGRLAELMHDTLGNSERRLDEVMLRRSVLTGPSFEADLAVVLAEARNRLVADGRVFRRPPPGHYAPRPILEGP